MIQTTLRDYLQTTEDAISSGRIADALANCQQLLQYYPNSLEVQRLLGEVYLAQGDLAKAQHSFDWVITNDPENVIAYCSRALISERLSDYDTALDCYQQAYELSRGNSQIRQEFNQLSGKVGPQQFIFSRAGLARIYMRGDLLPQALQEWEIVLATNPERLDARTGLLETYWRAGLYDKVEQVAQQILHDVPGCLKALLLLAHVIHAQNMHRAQQLLEQARTLDPDMVMAQELFSDLMASQVRDPFLSLLKKAPAALGEAPQAQPVADLASATASSAYDDIAYDIGTFENGPQASSPFSDSLLTWEGLDTIMEPSHEQRPVQESSPFRSESNHTPSELNAWTSLQDEQLLPGTNSSSSSQLVTPAPSANSLDIAQSEPIATTNTEPAEQAQEEDFTPRNADFGNELEPNQQSWYDKETFEMPQYATWNSPPVETSSLDTVASWDTNNLGNDVPTPPAWLEMLTGSGWKLQEDNIPAISEIEEAVAGAQSVEHIETLPQNSYSTGEEQFPAPETFPVAQGEDEEFSFGPAWLRSLGATSIDDVLPSEPAPELPDAPIVQNFSAPSDETKETTVQNDSVIQEPVEADAMSAAPKTPAEIWLSQAAAQLSQSEQNLDKTLEALENDLRMQGFVHLEPGMLSTVAPGQEDSQGTDEKVPDISSSVEATPGTHEEDEPLWPAVRISPRPDFEADAAPAPSPAPLAAPDQQSELKPVPVVHASNPAQFDPLLDSDLETTMKRPVLRLPASQPRSSVSHIQPVAKNHSNEQPRQNVASEGNKNNKERLITGYQYQRAGSYDEAMQEYRVIIRNAPELLGEVVSNLRALLKLAPRYAPGYRVLGDAYMRQGEYLQAMEAYNKALTMARKAKG